MNVLTLLFLIGAVIGLPLYGYLCITSLDPVTGFFWNHSMILNIFYAVLIIIPLLMILITYFKKDKLSFSISNAKGLKILSFAVGILIILSGVMKLPVLFAGNNGMYVPMSVTVITVILVLASIISGLMFLKLGRSYGTEDKSVSNSSGLLIPMIWSLLTCVELFIQYPQIAGMPERTLYLLFLLSFTLFLIGQSRVFSDIDLTKGIRWSASFGFCTAFFGLMLTIGEISAFGSMSMPIVDAVMTFGISLYCLYFAINTKIEK